MVEGALRRPGRSPLRLFLCGTLYWFAVVAVTTLSAWALLRGAQAIHPLLARAVTIYLC